MAPDEPVEQQPADDEREVAEAVADILAYEDELIAAHRALGHSTRDAMVLAIRQIEAEGAEIHVETGLEQAATVTDARERRQWLRFVQREAFRLALYRREIERIQRRAADVAARKVQPAPRPRVRRVVTRRSRARSPGGGGDDPDPSGSRPWRRDEDHLLGAPNHAVTSEARR